MGGGRAGVIVAVGGDLSEELRIDPTPLLMEPKRLGEMVRVVGVRGIERNQPFLEGGPDGLVGKIPEDAASAVTGAVFVGFEEVEQFFDARSDNLGRRVERAVFPSHPPNAPLARVPPCVAEGILHVAEDRVVPVGNIERALGAELKIDRDARLVVRFEDFAEASVLEGRSVLRPVVKQNPLVVLVLVREDFALELIRPVPTCDKLLPAVAVVAVPITGVGDVTGLRLVDEGCVVVAGDVEMFSPAIDGIAPGISSGWKAGNNLQAMGPRIEAVDGIVLASASP